MSWTLNEVSKHKTSESCWVIIKNKVYDVTSFLNEHPGGAAIILKYAGRDATAVYEPIHPADALEKHLPKSKHLGPVNTEAAGALEAAVRNRKKTKDEVRMEEAHKYKPKLSHILSLRDMEDVAKRVLPHKAYAYYSSSTEDTISKGENARAFARFFFKARVMRPVNQCDPATTILGFKSSIPVFVSGAAMAKLAHPDGELNITRGCAAQGIIQMVSSNASYSYADIAQAMAPEQTLFFQLYKHKDDAIALQRIREIETLGYKAIFLTVDAVVPSKREFDIRAPWYLEDLERGAPSPFLEEQADSLQGTSFGTAGGLIVNDDRDMTWEKTIPWLRSVTKLPIVIKGIQCVEDAILAAKAGVDGILISNHGGRQLDYSFPPLEVLYRLRKGHPEVFKHMEVYIDGGITRGTDVLKAICLGATAVGLGRAYLYAQGAYGVGGVKRITHILETEIVTAMRLMGASRIEDLTPELVERVDWQPEVKARL
ncbi:FMN-dependent dehydrogenase-domain-containing protein [Schizophyllum amplum]|uniref:L-lactate dehydrogenase (cytochrome) n=1 Tax=Schizophyllum amplum TaxID=97359 RepID=A0A550CLU6_9AGAR|nr:FMN-dependent dehydrogenase-domain-containing protein [Auriculariopsis ampla]